MIIVGSAAISDFFLMKCKNLPYVCTSFGPSEYDSSHDDEYMRQGMGKEESSSDSGRGKHHRNNHMSGADAEMALAQMQNQAQYGVYGN